MLGVLERSNYRQFSYEQEKTPSKMDGAFIEGIELLMDV